MLPQGPNYFWYIGGQSPGNRKKPNYLIPLKIDTFDASNSEFGWKTFVKKCMKITEPRRRKIEAPSLHLQLI